MISTTSQYALRALSELAALKPGEALKGRLLAERADIPANYLSKLLLSLRNGGWVATTRGVGGGYRLNLPAADIHLLDVLEMFDGLRSRPKCLLESRDCREHDSCPAHHAWKEVREAYIRFLENTSVADISPRKGLLQMGLPSKEPEPSKRK